MAVLTAQGLCLTHTGPPLLNGVDMQIHRGDRLCLLGRNGAGKSTLMHILAGTARPDSGTVQYDTGVEAAHLPQEIPAAAMDQSVYAVVASGLGQQGESLVAYQRCLEALDFPFEVRRAKVSLTCFCTSSSLTSGRAGRFLALVFFFFSFFSWVRPP